MIASLDDERFTWSDHDTDELSRGWNYPKLKAITWEEAMRRLADTCQGEIERMRAFGEAATQLTRDMFASLGVKPTKKCRKVKKYWKRYLRASGDGESNG